MPERIDAPLAPEWWPKRVARITAGGICIAIGVVSLPLPLFPSLLFIAIGVLCLARSSVRARRWLAAQDWLTHRLHRLPHGKLRDAIRSMLGV